MLSILKASAGSGKTYSLTYDYIRLLLGYKDDDGRYRINLRKRDRHRHILAITFTNKATDEMKERIIHELAVLAGMETGWESKTSPYLDSLTKEFDCDSRQVKIAAGKALRQLLFDFNYFHVSTIDAFFQVILRTFAREAELDGNYELDLDTDRAIGYGVDELFTSLSLEPDTIESKNMVSWITRYLLEELRNGRSINLFNRGSHDYDKFIQLIAKASDEKFAENFDRMMEYLSTDKIAVYRKGIRRESANLRRECREAAVSALEAIAAYPLPKGKISQYLLNQLADISDSGFDDGRRVSVANTAAGADFFTAPARPFFADGAMAPLYNAVTGACRTIVDNSANITILDHIASNLFMLGLLRGVYTRVEQFRSENNTLLLSDTNSLLNKIIKGAETPFIYERVGVDFRHFLIDEFQDTSRLQWDNLQPLLNESQANGFDNLIIGDEKQCIYRFRSSDPSLLQHKVKEEVINDVRVRGTAKGENTNWRSSADVVQFNNALFHTMAGIYGFSDIYANVRQNVAESNINHHGYVSMQRFSDSATYSDEALEHMASEIKRQLASGYDPCHIAVLTRVRADAVKVIDYLLDIFANDPVLSDRKIRIISDDSLSVDSSPSVKRVISILRSIGVTKRDDDEQTDIRNRSRRELENMVGWYEFNIGRGQAPSTALTNAVDECCRRLELDAQLRSMQCENLPALIERIVHFYFPDHHIPNGEEVYMLAFEDAVADFCTTSQTTDVQSFLRWWDTVGCRTRLSAAADRNALRVMTIHKSKGLEFKCVHIPFVDWPVVKFRDSEWFTPQPVRGVPDSVIPPLILACPMSAMRHTLYASEYEKRHREQMLDELNVLYVAFTRAIDELIVSYYAPEKEKKAKSAPVDDNPALSTPSAGEMVSTTLLQLGRTDILESWGEPTSAKADKQKPRKALEPTQSIAMPVYSVDLRDNLLDYTGIDTDTTDSGRQRGNIMHDILANTHTVNDLHRAVGYVVRRGALPTSQRDDTKRILSEALASVESYGWFSGFKKAYRERAIQLAPGKTVRPDRVVWTADGHIDIIDFKFGHEHPRDYNRQLRTYIDAYAAVGYKGVRGFIWYVDLRKVVPYTPPTLPI